MKGRDGPGPGGFSFGPGEAAYHNGREADTMTQAPAAEPTTPEDPYSGVPLGIPDDPWLSLKIIRWARTTGPRIGKVHRAILIDLAAYCDAEGIATPSQETIATNVEASRGAVNAALQDLEGLELLQSWNRSDDEGNHKNAYQLMGHFNEWMPFYREEDAGKPVISMLCDRNKQLQREKADMHDFLRESGLEQAFAERQLSAHEGSRSNTPIYKTNMGINYDDGGSNVILDDISPSTLDLRREIAEWVAAQWEERLGKTWKKRQSTAIRWYLAHPEDYREQRREQEEEDSWEQPVPETTVVNIDTAAVPSDPAADGVWKDVLFALEEQLPAPAFRTLFRGVTAGWSLDQEELLVLCETHWVVQQLEMRYYRSIYRAVAAVLGREVDVQLGVLK